MEISMEWNAICRVCLQEGQLQSFYDKDEKDMPIYEKILKCSNITIKRGMNLPEQICDKCLGDLEVAYRFRTNCESSDAILQSLIEGNVVTDLVMSSETGEVYKYKPPSGLKVKRIRPLPLKVEATSDIDDNQIENTIIEDNGISDHEAMPTEEYTVEKEGAAYDQGDGDGIVDNLDLYEDIIVMRPTKPYKTRSEHLTVNVEDIIVRPVKTNKARSEKLSNTAASAEGNTSKAEGSGTKRNRKLADGVDKNLKICEICGNTYKYKHALESHMRRHRNEKPFACEICGRAFVINFELRRHMRTHTGQKPYECRYCGRKYSDFGSRSKHERTHTGERPYVCETCGRAFAYSHVLSSHILTHTGEKRYACTVCSKRFTKAHHLKAHMNTHTKNSTKLIVDYNYCDPSATSTANQENVETTETQVIYETEQNDQRTYGEVLAVLNEQPKIDEFVDEVEMKVIISEEEHRQAVDSINMQA